MSGSLPSGIAESDRVSLAGIVPGATYPAERREPWVVGFAARGGSAAANGNARALRPLLEETVSCSPGK
jgi:hypothetical protein